MCSPSDPAALCSVTSAGETLIDCEMFFWRSGAPELGVAALRVAGIFEGRDHRRRLPRQLRARREVIHLAGTHYSYNWHSPNVPQACALDRVGTVSKPYLFWLLG